MNVRLHVAEPSAHDMSRPALVLDCSVLAGLVFREEWFESAQAQIEDRSLHAPHLLMHEISSVTLKKIRRQEAHALPCFEQALQMDIALHVTDTAQTFALAQHYQLTAYDASYLWLAAELRCPLATFDEQLAQAARLHLSHLT